MSIPASVLSAIFSDETELYRYPAEPDPGNSVALRIRVARGSASRVMLYTGQDQVAQLMSLVTWFHQKLTISSQLL